MESWDDLKQEFIVSKLYFLVKKVVYSKIKQDLEEDYCLSISYWTNLRNKDVALACIL